MGALIDESKKPWEKKSQGYYKKVLLKGKEIGAEGAVFQKVRFPKGVKIGAHFHRKQTEIFYVSKGSAVIEINGKKYKAEIGKSFIIKPNDQHAIDNSKGGEDFEMAIFKVNEPEENDFFGPLAERFPILEKLAALLKTTSPQGIQLSGSGSTMFGIFASAEARDRAAASLEGNKLANLFPARVLQGFEYGQSPPA